MDAPTSSASVPTAASLLHTLGRSVSRDIAGKELRLSAGSLARQAGGSILVQYGGTVVLGTATIGEPMGRDADFMPLLVEYEEKFYAAGKIKGSRFIKREGRPSDDAIIASRLIDRSIRPLFPDNMINDVQVVTTVLSFDGENDPDVLAIVAAAGALMLSNVPWEGPLAAVRVGRSADQFVLNPTSTQRQESQLDLVVAGTGDRIVMIEAGANELDEAALLDAITFGQEALGAISGLLVELQQAIGRTKVSPTLMAKNPALDERIRGIAEPVLTTALTAAASKDEISQAASAAIATVLASLSESEKEQVSERYVRRTVNELHGVIARQRVLQDGWREGGRQLDEIRPLAIQVGVLPRTHGSSVFQRGETQILNVLTLGGPGDVLFIDTMEIEAKKRYIHYYNFPAYSVGEIKPNRGPGRREIGHGALAERALIPVLPDQDSWKYTMLLVSEVLESNGSSSMASVCASSLSLMDAGVPIKQPVAGIAMGLMTDGQGAHRILTDIAGIEDEKGDMDFKVAGTRTGITALQMDIKVTGITRRILTDALAQAKQARLQILDAMAAVLAAPRPELPPHAPRIEVLHISVEKIGDLIGPKGKHINEIIEKTGVEIDIEDDGSVSITSTSGEGLAKAKEWVHNLTREIKPGERFEGKVTRVMDFGAFVALTPNVEGMVHISQFRDEHVENISDVAKVGDIIPVVVVEIDAMGRINLSHKGALPGGTIDRPPRPEGPFSRPPRPRRPGFGGERPPRDSGNRPRPPRF